MRMQATTKKKKKNYESTVFHMFRVSNTQRDSYLKNNLHSITRESNTRSILHRKSKLEVEDRNRYNWARNKMRNVFLRASNENLNHFHRTP